MSSNGGGDNKSDDGRASSASSYTSGDFGGVARSGFTRMYVLLHSSMCPIDTSDDYQSEFIVDDRDEDDDDAKADDSVQLGQRRQKEARASGRYRDIRGEYDGNISSSASSSPRYQLLYASGSHYFHGTIEMPENLGLEKTGASNERGDDEDSSILPEKRAHWPHKISIADLPVLLPHFQGQQDALLAIDKISDFRSEIRDVLYQMEEVGEFMVEELSKDKTIERIEQVSKELHWIVSPTNPTFFELQTNSSTNDDLDEAGVVLIVMKIVVREVLLDVIYAHNSYYVVLRENSEELSLKDTFIPNGEATKVFVREHMGDRGTDGDLFVDAMLLLHVVARAGPCFVVRQYKCVLHFSTLHAIRSLTPCLLMPTCRDEDIAKLVLWCALPTPGTKNDLVIEGKGVTPVALPLHPDLLSGTSKTNAKVKPIAACCEREVLHANDTQMYCLLPYKTQNSGEKQMSRRARTKQGRRSQRKSHSNDSDGSEGDGAEDDEQERRDIVIFQFNQYVYSGELWIRPTLMDDLAKLSTHVFPHLRAQSHLLEFRGEADDLPASSSRREADDGKSTDQMHRFASVRCRFDEVAPTLLTMVIESQSWIQEFLAEVDVAVATEDSTTSLPSSPMSSEWLASHLKAWLETNDCAEAFFELELGAGKPFDINDEQVDLIVWKGIVNTAVMVVVYRDGSFIMMLRELPSESGEVAVPDNRDLFGAIPPLGSKGRGYLVRKFPDTIHQESQRWLAGAKLLLWQTRASLVHEEIREARARDERRKSGKQSDSLCTDWFVDGEDVTSAADAKAGSSDALFSEVRSAQLTDAKCVKDTDTDSKKLWAAPSKASAPSADKVGRRHHIPPLGTPVPQAKIGTVAPWDLRTGRPV